MIDSIPARLKDLGTSPQSQNSIAYNYKENGSWIEHSFGQYYNETLRFAKALLSLDFNLEDKISILAFNRPEWVISDLGTMMAGGIPAGIYQTCSPEEVAYIISHSESKVVVVENEEQWNKVNQFREQFKQLQKIVLMRGCSVGAEDPQTIQWEDFLALGSEIDDHKITERLEELTPNQPATFIYTSGTTGPPKAVMLSHENLTFTADKAVELVDLNSSDCTLSYLPLSHIAEQVFSIHGPITAGSSIYFAEDLDKVRENLVEVQPTVFFGVPRIWEKFFAKIQLSLGELPWHKAKLFQWASGVGKNYHNHKNKGLPGSIFLRSQYKLAKKLAFNKAKKKIGLGRAKICVSGAAPISAEILEFMSGLDVVIREVYGQSEDTGPTSFNQPGATQFGSVGPIFPGVEVKIAEDDEILVRGKNVFLGYYKDEEATQKTVIDGWLHSGDLGKFDENGYLYIIGRKKEIIITAGGKNISPKNIESDLKDLPLVSQAVVIGDKRKFLSALITLDLEILGTRSFTEPAHEDSQIIKEIQDGVDAMNKRLARVENIRKFRVLPRDFSIDKGELTPTLKIKRRIIYDNWAEEIDQLYED
ncbi:MAG: long-chain fatty acid--CoA ligase [Proteobacteria bacterium]|nr:long-chain fatty acid--CoA ligase [Pseudomonadota bacterium]